MFTPLHSSTNQELFKKYVCNQSSHYENTMVPHTPVIVWNWSIHFPSLSGMFNLYTAIWINNCLKSTSVIKVATMKIQTIRFGTISITQRKPSHATTKLMLFTVSKDEWNTLESLKNALNVLWYAKRHLLGWSDVEQWKNQFCSLSCYRVTLVWRHQLVS